MQTAPKPGAVVQGPAECVSRTDFFPAAERAHAEHADAQQSERCGLGHGSARDQGRRDVAAVGRGIEPRCRKSAVDVLVAGQEIPIGRQYRETVLGMLGRL